MSLNVGGGRLLAEALADAMDRDLAGVPPQESLEELHHFSKKFVRGIRRIQSGKTKKEKKADFQALGAWAKRRSGLAAALVCVVGLAAVAGVMTHSFRMGYTGSDASKADGAAPESAADNAAAEDAVDDAALEEVQENTADDAADTGTGDSASGQLSETVPSDEKTTPAPDWQEQLLLESAKADEYVSWHLNMAEEDGMIALASQVHGDSEHGGATQMRTVRVSEVYEVYYEQSRDEWERVYHTDRMMAEYTGDVYWEEGYLPEDLNMTRAGVYRLVRQVNSYRQVLQLTLSER